MSKNYQPRKKTTLSLATRIKTWLFLNSSNIVFGIAFAFAVLIFFQYFIGIDKIINYIYLTKTL